MKSDSATDVPKRDDADAMETETPTPVGGGLAAFCSLKWQRGVQAPPFVASNLAAVQLCEGIIAGTVMEIPHIFLSEAVAVQIYRLVMDRQRAAPSLNTYFKK